MSNSGKKSAGDDEVEQLLRAAQDDVLLKLNLNSHMARGSSSSAAIDPDLDRRFRALRKPPTNIDDPIATSTGEVGDDDGGDLFARFAALKKSIPSSHNRNGDKGEFKSDVVNEEEEEEGSEDDEVEKVMKWAIDAARLDPSPPSDDDDVDVDYNNEEDDDGSDDDDSDGGRKKGKRK